MSAPSEDDSFKHSLDEAERGFAPTFPIRRTTIAADLASVTHAASANLPYSHTLPPRTRTLDLPRTITIQEDDGFPHDRELRLRRQGSISITTGPQRADTASRIVGEFRTLSIHVTDSQQRPLDSTNKRQTVKDVAELEWHTLKSTEVLQRLTTSAETGLDKEQAKRRLATNGPNEMSPPPKNLIKKWLNYIFGGFGTILFIASVLCFISWKPLGEPDPQVSNLALAVVILIVIVIQTGFNAWQDWSTGRVMASIAGMLPSDVLVLRDGAQEHIPSKELVTGDIVFVSLGNKLPADLRFIEVSSDLKLDRSVLTGESEPIAATVDSTDSNFLETKNIGLQGTLCVSGSGLGVVVQTGDNTVFGRIAKLSSSAKAGLTTLQKEILRFVLIIVFCALTIAIIVIICWGAWLNKDHKGFITNSNLVIDVVSVCVAFVPEGMPASVTISLAVVADKLAKSKILCKSLMTVETLGAINVLCSDKTGTLTRNVMTVTNVAVLDDEMEPLEARDRVVAEKENATCVRQLAAVAGICNAAKFDPATMDQPVGLRLINGDATDSAILRFAETIRPVKDSNADWNVLFKVDFNSKTKFMLKLLSPVNPSARAPPIADTDTFDNEDYVLVCKGAPDVLLARCKYINDPSGTGAAPLLLTPDIRERLTSVQIAWAAKGQRVLLLAKRIVPKSMIDQYPVASPSFPDDMNMFINQDLTVVGLVGLVDPPRPDIPDTVATMRRAGIRFFMVTGDFAITAEAIARQCGIITSVRTDRLADLPRDSPTPPLESSEKNSLTLRNKMSRKQDDNVNNRDTLAEEEDKWPSNGLVLSGPDLMEMNENQWEHACRYREIVFARTTPEQKLRIVKEFQSRDCVVGMTGDGVNDAPSLKAADIGIAMGGGSDVAMEAADLVLLEAFSSIVVAVEYGRLVFDNLKKTVLYLLPAGSFSELMPILLNVFLGLPQILSNIQMILICVVTDVLPAIALCFEKPEAGLLERPPRDVKKDNLVNWKLLFHAYSLGVIETLCASSMAFWYLQREGYPFSDLVLAYGSLPPQFDPNAFSEAINRAQSVYFFTLVGMQWGNLLSTRTRRLSFFQANPFLPSSPSRNWWIPPAMLTSLAFLFFFSYVPFFQNIFLTRGVEVEYIFLPFTFAIGMFILDELRKLAVRKYPNGILAKVAW